MALKQTMVLIWLIRILPEHLAFSTPKTLKANMKHKHIHYSAAPTKNEILENIMISTTMPYGKCHIRATKSLAYGGLR